jgi:hypothetical protein
MNPFQPTNTDTQRLEQLAGYLAHGIDPSAAATAVGFSRSRVSQLLQTEDFKALVAERSHEILTQYVDMNKTYDEIERTALKNVAEVLKWNRDPDLNMKAAMLANRAVRRGQFGHEQQPLTPNGNGERISIALSFNLIQKVQRGEFAPDEQMKVVNGTTEENLATPQMVEQILSIAATNTVDLPVEDRIKKHGLAGLLEPID